MSFQSDIAAELAALINTGELSQTVVLRRSGQADQSLLAVLAELPGEEFDDHGRVTLARRRLTAASGATFRPNTDSHFLIGGENWDVLGPPLDDGLTVTVELVKRSTYGKGRK